MKSDSIRAILGALHAAQSRFLIVGGLAVVAHGYLRFTADIDLAIALDPENAHRSLNALASLGYHPRMPVPMADFSDATIRETWIREKGMVVFQLISELHPETPVDIFAQLPFDFETELSRSRSLPLGNGLDAPVLSLSALLDMKRAVGRPQDLLDVEQLEKQSDE
jgi:hypothetical protein